MRATVGRTSHAGTPTFTVCPRGSRAKCRIGDLPTGQSDELQARLRVYAGATAGERIALTASASAKAAAGYRSSASVLVISAGSPSASVPPTLPGTTIPLGTSPTGTPGTFPTVPLGLFPTVTPSLPAGTSSKDPAGLFPTVSPSSGAAAAGPAGQHHGRQLDVTTTSAILPLNPRLIGVQLAGLAVLAGAIAIAIVRLSLRTTRTADGGADGKRPPDHQ